MILTDEILVYLSASIPLAPKTAARPIPSIRCYRRLGQGLGQDRAAYSQQTSSGPVYELRGESSRGDGIPLSILFNQHLCGDLSPHKITDTAAPVGATVSVLARRPESAARAQLCCRHARRITPQAIFIPGFPDGCVVKSSGPLCITTVRPTTSSTENRPVST